MMIGDVVEGIPVEARVRTAKGAEAFVRYYLDVYNDVMVHPRADRLAPLSGTTCKTCANWVSESDSLVESDESYANSPVILRRAFAGASSIAKDDTFSVFASIAIPAAIVVDRSNRTVRTSAADDGLLEFQLAWSEGWRAAFVRLVETKK